MNPDVFTTSLALFMTLMARALSLQCYDCSNYVASDNCENPGIGTHVAHCKNSENFCRKVEQKITIDGEDRTVIFRSCAQTADSPDGECVERLGSYRFKSLYCECSGSKCNSAVSCHVSGLLATLSVMLVFILKMTV